MAIQRPDRTMLVRLAQKADLNILPGELMFYDVVDASLTSRSSVLSCIAEAGGEVTLPQAITPSEFRLWLTASAAGATCSLSLHFSALCTVLKVRPTASAYGVLSRTKPCPANGARQDRGVILQIADALDDRHLSEWVQLAADHLMDAAIDNDDTDSEDGSRGDAFPDTSSQEAADGLSVLPNHVQDQILAAACARKAHCLHFLHDFLPRSLHSKVIAACISSPDRTLHLTISRCCPLLISSLTALPASPPSVGSLQVQCDMCASGTRGASPHVLVVQRAAHLASALRHHAGLSSLGFSGRFCVTDAVNLIVEAITSLTSLQSLHLGTKFRPCSASTLPDVQRAVRNLSQLKTLSLHVFPHSEWQPPSCKRPLPLPLHDVLPALLSSASLLTSLTIGWSGHHCEAIKAVLEGEDEAAVTLPHLSHLALVIQECTLAVNLLSRMQAPLTRLSLEASCTYNATVSEATHTTFWQCLATFSRLQALGVTCDVRTWTHRAVAAALAHPPALTSLSHLQEVHLSADFYLLVRVAPQLHDAFPALQKLALWCTHTQMAVAPALPVLPEAWVDVLGAIRSLQLPQLALTVVGDGGEGGPALSDLRPLTGLSALQLQHYSSITHARHLVLLAEMTQLRFLELGHISLPEAASGGLVLSMLALRSLTALVLRGRIAAEGLADACAAGQLAGAWPALRGLGMPVDVSQPAADIEPLLRAVCGLPALQRLAVECTSGDDYGSDSDSEQAYCSRLSRSLRRVVMAAGVALFDGFTFAECGQQHV